MKSILSTSIALFVILSVCPAFGQTFVFDENGHAAELTTSGGTLPIPFSTVPAPLTYHLGYPSVAGDILIFEPGGATNVLSDILRFDTQGNVTVFSDASSSDPPDSLADVLQFPAPLPGAISVLENGPGGAPGLEGSANGLFGYQPAPGTPGASPAGAAPFTFNFISDVPEPSSWALMLLVAGLGLLIRRSRPIA
ncbi:MAG TPA: PEP-CTERM sorting domain-containing protein [Tepidisphaeraceae bacterium]|nr:PEP-CTERM sorting domain-containing protein [Tepidisphaeraceae bacterium]